MIDAIQEERKDAVRWMPAVSSDEAHVMGEWVEDAGNRSSLPRAHEEKSA